MFICENISVMPNVLEQFRRDEGLNFAEIGRRVGLSRATVLMHCKGERPIGGEAAIRYSSRLGIPLADLRPDLFSMDSPTIVSQNSPTKGRVA
jgi:transcriptional regulator with XRE-family HTH domain